MKKDKLKYIVSFGLCALALLSIGYYYFLTPLSAHDDTQYLYIDNDDTADSVCVKVSAIASSHATTAFRILTNHSSYAEHIRTGRYEITPSQPTIMAFRHIKNGMQTPFSLTLKGVRTKEILAASLSSKLMMDSLEIIQTLNNEEMCQTYGLDTANIIGMFIPDTYDFYWNISVGKFMERMHKSYENFWNEQRKQKAEALHLTPAEVTTLASIIDEETANNAEKPMIAGMYYKRLQIGMPLQADPTVKFALKDFAARRIYKGMLTADSPYNTYKNKGLPPGPIRIPSVAGIDAVLNLVHHNYLYMCAKEDFSGTHNFAETYAEHQQNAKRYVQALNERGIK